MSSDSEHDDHQGRRWVIEQRSTEEIWTAPLSADLASGRVLLVFTSPDLARKAIEDHMSRSRLSQEPEEVAEPREVTESQFSNLLHLGRHYGVHHYWYDVTDQTPHPEATLFRNHRFVEEYGRRRDESR